MRVLGLDPGIKGGIALISPDKASVIKLGDRNRILKTMMAVAPTVDHIYFELVGSMPNDGHRQAFSFGKNVGWIEMAITTAGAESKVVMVPPKEWQRFFGLLRKDADESDTSKKNRHKALAQKLFPHIPMTHYLADAILIAKYGYAKTVGSLGPTTLQS